MSKKKKSSKPMFVLVNTENGDCQTYNTLTGVLDAMEEFAEMESADADEIEQIFRVFRCTSEVAFTAYPCKSVEIVLNK